MRLAELVALLEQHGINLCLTDDGKIKPSSDQQPPTEVIHQMREGVRQHRAVLVRRLDRNQRADGRYYLVDLLPVAGICASCGRWQPFTPTDLHGRCVLADALGRHGAHPCDVSGWVRRTP